MTIEKKMLGTTAGLKLVGWLDTLTAPALGEAVEALDSSVTDLVLDCSELEYISSAGLRQFIASHKKMNGNMTLRDVSDEIMSVIRIAGFENRMKFE